MVMEVPRVLGGSCPDVIALTKFRSSYLLIVIRLAFLTGLRDCAPFAGQVTESCPLGGQFDRHGSNFPEDGANQDNEGQRNEPYGFSSRPDHDCRDEGSQDGQDEEQVCHDGN